VTAAARAAAEARAAAVADGDRHLADLAGATAGEPVLVRDAIALEPSYWSVPLERDGRVVGFARVSLDGTATAVGVRRGGGPVTGVDAATARAMAVDAAGSVDDSDDIGEPVYVHDGPPGREAWLVVVEGRRFFITAGGASERPAGSG
jgi:hypothetical protein